MLTKIVMSRMLVSSIGVVAITFRLHRKGLGFNPRMEHNTFLLDPMEYLSFWTPRDTVDTTLHLRPFEFWCTNGDRIKNLQLIPGTVVRQLFFIFLFLILNTM